MKIFASVPPLLTCICMFRYINKTPVSVTSRPIITSGSSNPRAVMANINNTDSQTVDTFLTLTLTLQPQHFMVGFEHNSPCLECLIQKIQSFISPQNCKKLLVVQFSSLHYQSTPTFCFRMVKLI